MPSARVVFPAGDRAEIATAVTGILADGMLTLGHYTRQFETAFAAAHGAPHAVAVGSGTAALDIVLRAVRAATAGKPISIAGTGEQHRNCVYVEDLADAHVRALSPAAVDQVLALEGGTPVSVREIADTVAELAGQVPVEHVAARTADYQGMSVSNRAARELLHWSPETSFTCGVRRYLDWLSQTGGFVPGDNKPVRLSLEA